jgi:hypothetical protein
MTARFVSTSRARSAAMIPKYPIYIPSRGRYGQYQALTVRALQRDQVPFRLVVEPSEADLYAPWVTDRDQLLVLPRNNFTLLNARNWVRDHAEAEGHERHWQLDDNISIFYRLWVGERIPVHAGFALAMCEQLTDRFSNVGLSGLNYTMFVPRNCRTPFSRNVHVYSCTLVNHRMPYRWRMTLNDDTDICLQALTNGWGTLLVSAFNAQKVATMTLSGGNTDSLYRTEDEGDARDTYGRYEMARVLERAWPGTVRISRKFGRYQHSVNWPMFARQPIRSTVDFAEFPDVDEHGLVLRRLRDPKSSRVDFYYNRYAADLAAARNVDPWWRGMPAFIPTPEPPKLAIECFSEEDRDALVARLGVSIAKNTRGTLSAWWPPRDRNDFASLRFEPADVRRDRGEDDEPKGLDRVVA